MSHRSRSTIIKTSAAAVFIAAALFIIPSSPAIAEGLGDMRFDSKIESMKKAGVKAVIFPHTLHADKNECSACHPAVFAQERGANDISMRANMKGQFCGTANCHNSPNAFPLYECAKCHTGK